MIKKPKILFYDIETILMLFYAFSTGKQYLGHKQLLAGKSRFGIICITYCWNNGPAKIIRWTPDGGLDKVIQEFDALVKTADFCIGKNSDRFDTKMINGCRIFTDQPGFPEWTKYTDDLEKQMRRYLRLPSQSLDYISSQFGLGGKVKMDFSDWVLIDHYMTVESLKHEGLLEDALEIFCLHMYKKSYIAVLKDGLKAFNKMCFYGKKDVIDTRTLWFKLSEHFDSKWNQAQYQEDAIACKHMDCGSTDLVRVGVRTAGMTKYQEWKCKSCHRYAGRSTISNNGKDGRIS